MLCNDHSIRRKTAVPFFAKELIDQEPTRSKRFTKYTMTPVVSKEAIRKKSKILITDLSCFGAA